MSTSPVRLSLHDVHADVWHAHTLADPVAQVVATGEAALDAQLPGGGWPVGALTELLQAPGVHAEWRLLLPALVRCGPAAVALIGAPHMPFGPALAARGLAHQRLLWVQASAAPDRLWSAEQTLRCAGVDAVVAWLPQARSDQLRRLQMAAAQYSKLLMVVRGEAAQHEASPAVLRMLLQPHVNHLQLHILKRRGPPLDHPVLVPACHAALARVLAASDRMTPIETAQVNGAAGADVVPWQMGSEVPQPEFIHVLDRTAARA